MTKAYTNIIENPEEIAEWLAGGLTYLIPKAKGTTNPKNCGPITCLPTLYTILTSIIAERTHTFLTEHQQNKKGAKKKATDVKIGY